MLFHIHFTSLKIEINKSSLMIPKSTIYSLEHGIFLKLLLEKNRGLLELQCFYEMVDEITKIKINAEKKHKVFV